MRDNKGGDPQTVKGEEWKYRSHDKTGVCVVEFGLLLDIELHVGIRQRLLIRTGNLERYRGGEKGGGRGRNKERKGRGEGVSQTELGSPVLVYLPQPCWPAKPMQGGAFYYWP